MSGNRRGGSGSGQSQIEWKAGSTAASTIAGGGTQIWLIKRLNGRSLVLIFWRTTVPSAGKSFCTRYRLSSTSKTVSPTATGATRPEEITTGTAGVGAAERPRNWNEDLKAKKTHIAKIKRGLGGRRGVRRKDATYGNVCEKS